MARKRSASDNETVLCGFCEQSPAAVAVQTTRRIASSKTTTTETQWYCLLHYYTTPAVRRPPESVIIVNEAAHQDQLPAVQELFAEGFVQLQQELSEAQARSTAQQGNPLAILHHIHKKATKRTPKPKKLSKQSEEGAGFLKQIATPERLVRTQQAQAKKHAALVRRMQAAAEGKSSSDISARRPSSRKSIWNQVLETSRNDTEDDPSSASAANTAAAIEEAANRHATAVCHACGSDRVRTLASHTARDVRKNEIWGGGSSNEGWR